jgi:hypothetical protein
MRFVAIITSVMFFALSSLASTNVKIGDIVEEDGVLLSVEEAAKIVAEKRVSVERCEEKVVHASNLTKIEKQLVIKNLQTDLKAEREKAITVISIKDKEIDRLYSQLESETGQYGPYITLGAIVVGVLLTSLVNTAIFFAAVQASQTGPVVK